MPPCCAPWGLASPSCLLAVSRLTPPPAVASRAEWGGVAGGAAVPTPLRCRQVWAVSASRSVEAAGRGFVLGPPLQPGFLWRECHRAVVEHEARYANCSCAPHGSEGRVCVAQPQEFASSSLRAALCLSLRSFRCPLSAFPHRCSQGRCSFRKSLSCLLGLLAGRHRAGFILQYYKNYSGKQWETMLKLHGRPVAGAMWLYFLHRRRASPRPCGRLPAADIMFTMGGDGGRRAALQLAQRAVLRCHAACLACWNGLFGKAKQAVLQLLWASALRRWVHCATKTLQKAAACGAACHQKASTGHAGQHLPCVAGMWLKARLRMFISR